MIRIAAMDAAMEPHPVGGHTDSSGHAAEQWTAALAEIGRRIKVARLHRCATVRALAQHAGVSRTWLSALECGRVVVTGAASSPVGVRAMPLALLWKLADALEVPAACLIPSAEALNDRRRCDRERADLIAALGPRGAGPHGRLPVSERLARAGLWRPRPVW